VYLPQETIRQKRDRLPLAAADIEAFVRGMTEGTIGEAQIAALAMAVFLNGMTREETVALTQAMRESGRVLRWRGLDGPVLDKHSTGGIGDKVSLVLAPVIAAAGGYVPMISGRALGHTGGTLDKLESIPGYGTAPDETRLRQVVAEAGCAIVGQTDDLAPADRRFYAVRDVTATVESLPLITASILSKKLAAGLEGLVMDVKHGSGAFMAEIGEARRLARTIVEVAAGAGLPSRALVTDMNQCLGRSAGNALEVREAIAFLRGDPVESRLEAVVTALCGELMVLGGLAGDLDEAGVAVRHAIASGGAAERFAAMVRGLGGPADLVDAAERHLDRAPVVRPARAPRAGHVRTIDTRALGLAVVGLGGGRRQTTDRIDHAVGLDAVAGVGTRVEAGDALALIHARSEAAADRAAETVRAAFEIAADPITPDPVVAERLAG